MCWDGGRGEREREDEYIDKTSCSCKVLSEYVASSIEGRT